ncbi:MAG: hypothetical protein U9N76_03610, partial [Candidatus Marinimicrobia bacterium]|nr:hypothetical protein [Candidatus Neomarinimicrobiota bacterium]
YFTIFCPIFFDNIEKISGLNKDLEHYFPAKWKITSENIKNIESHIILNKLMQWLENKIYKDNKEKYNLSDVLNFFFPKVDSDLFTAFLNLLSLSNLEDALNTKPNFLILNMNSFIYWTGEISDKEKNNLREEKTISQTNETIQIIIKYFFRHWNKLRVAEDDLREEQLENWEEMKENEKEKIFTEVRKKKLEQLKERLNSSEIKKYCKGSEIKEENRKTFEELINLLIKEIGK